MNIFYIHPSQSFLKSLARGIRERFDDDVRVILDSDKACNALKEELDERNIINLGDLGVTQFVEKHECKERVQSLPSVIDYKRIIAKELTKRFAKKEGLSSSDVIEITDILLEIISQLMRDEVSHEQLENLLRLSCSKHVENIAKYAAELIKIWPTLLKREGFVDCLEKQRSYVRGKISEWEERPPKYPIMLVVTSELSLLSLTLARVLLNMPNGFVIIDNLDVEIDDQVWNNIDDSHPFFQRKEALRKLNVSKDSLQVWDNGYEECDRVEFVKNLFLPRNDIHRWAELKSDDFRGLRGIEYAECRSLREEALVVLLRAKELLATTNDRIAIVVNDRNLTKIFMSLSKLWDIEIQNASGTLFKDSDYFHFTHIVFDVLRQNFSPVPFLALLKHKLVALGCNVEMLENKYFRGVVKYSSLSELIELVEEEELSAFLKELHKIYEPLSLLLKQTQVPFNIMLQEVMALMVRLSSELEADVSNVIGYISQYTEFIHPDKFIEVFDLLSYREKCDVIGEFSEVRVRIISLSDVNLFDCKHVIVTGLNEGTMPETPSSRDQIITSIYNAIDMSRTDGSISQFAGILCRLMHARSVLLTRASVIDNTICTPSRWFVRLKLLADKIGVQICNELLVERVRDLYLPSELVQYKLPIIKPSIEGGVRQLSVTQVEKLIRDPYSIYASCILKLKSLEEIDRVLSNADFGSFIHRVISEFSKRYHALDSNQYFEEIMKCGKRLAGDMIKLPVVASIWLTQLSKIANWIIDFESSRRDEGVRVYSEMRGAMELGACTLTCRADRIEVSNDGVTVIDFKTGGVPTQKDIACGFSPQLPLEALVLSYDGSVKELSYVQLGPGKNFGTVTNVKGDLSELLTRTRANVQELMNFYNSKHATFLVCPDPKLAPMYNDYEHLERREEVG